MAGLAVVEEALRRRPAQDWKIVMLGEEPGPVYNRVLLSKLLARDCGPGELELRPLSWYAAHQVDLRGGSRAESINVDRRAVIDESGIAHPYDALVIATGSRAFVPPIAGAGLPHVDVFRTWRDADALAATPPGTQAWSSAAGCSASRRRPACARAACASRSSSSPASSWASSSIPARRRCSSARCEAQGIVCRLGRSAACIEADRVVLDDGEELPATRVIVAAGVRAETSLAARRGMSCERGIVVDDALRTSAPAVWSVGECAEHRGVVYGLWSPLAEQARVAARASRATRRRFTARCRRRHSRSRGWTSTPAGCHRRHAGRSRRDPVERHAARDLPPARARRRAADERRARRRRLLRPPADRLLRTGDPVPADLLESHASPSADALAADPSANVCSCNDVSVGEVQAAIRRDGLTTVGQVGMRTRATTGCGGCTADIEALLKHEAAAARA